MHTATTSNTLDSFLGSSPRSHVDYTLPCLYKRNFTKAQRTKFGLSDDILGVVYLSPISLQNIVGSELLSAEKTTILLLGVEYAIERGPMYLEPMYGSYVSVMLDLVNLSKGS